MSSKTVSAQDLNMSSKTVSAQDPNMSNKTVSAQDLNIKMPNGTRNVNEPSEFVCYIVL